MKNLNPKKQKRRELLNKSGDTTSAGSDNSFMWMSFILLMLIFSFGRYDLNK